MNSYLPLGISIFSVGKLRNSPAITCVCRLESEYPDSPPTSSRVIQRLPKLQRLMIVFLMPLETSNPPRISDEMRGGCCCDGL